jgi:hypothetical protein
MTELLNNYIKEHDEFIDLLVKYYPLHEAYIARQSPQRTMDLRKQLKQMRMALKRIEDAAQLRMKERSVEWRSVNRLPKEEE